MLLYGVGSYNTTMEPLVPIYSYNLERVLGYILLKLFLEHMYIRPMIVSTTNIFRPELRCVVFSEMDLSDVPI